VHLFHQEVKEQDKIGKSQEPQDSKHYTLKNLYRTPPLPCTFTNKGNRTADTSKIETLKKRKILLPTTRRHTGEVEVQFRLFFMSVLDGN
jgi:hypothetical protein